MNEEIINDVDVQFCQYFNDKNKKCRTCSYVENVKYTSYKCEQDKNCYYKQLRRLKQENEKLKEIEQDYVNFKIAIADIKNIIEFRFKTPYMTFGLEETRKIVKDIEKIVNEVLNV